MQRGSLAIVGLGIKFSSHLTTEAKSYIENTDIVLYLTNEPLMEAWIKKNSRQSASLQVYYSEKQSRLETYQAMTNHILEHVRQNKHVCVAIYGHPTVLAKPALDAALLAKQDGFYVKILPGISSEDCLFSDLFINPGTVGWQSYEATDFLLHERKIETSSHLILWQVGIIGALTYPKNHCNKNAAKILMEYLLQYYDREHAVTSYVATLYPHVEPTIHKMKLGALSEYAFDPNATLYIPPATTLPCCPSMLKALNIDATFLSNHFQTSHSQS